MKKTSVRIVVLCGVLGIGLAGMVMANGAPYDDDPAMMVSPHVIVLAKVSAITVHTNIPASTVVGSSIMLDDVAYTGLGVDSLGHIVAKFSVADLDLVPGDATLTLTGEYKDGSEFSATDDVRVK